MKKTTVLIIFLFILLVLTTRIVIAQSATDLSERFKITRQSLEWLEEEGISSDVLEKLKGTQDHGITDEKEFLKLLKVTIGQEQSVINQSLILKHANLSVCEYKETRNPIPINLKTKKPYTSDERNQEPFAEASISKDKIQHCLEAKTYIKNHHIIFEDYRDAWQELAKETGDYAIPLLIEGGVFHANTPYDYAGTWDRKDDTGGIRLGEFRDPTITDTSKLTAEERKTFGIEEKDKPIALIRPEFQWKRVFIDSEVSMVIGSSEDTRSSKSPSPFIFSNITSFAGASFAGATTSFAGASFAGATTSFAGASFAGATTSFRGASFAGERVYFYRASFTGTTTDFGRVSFAGATTDFGRVSFAGATTSFAGASFAGATTSFRGASFVGEGVYFYGASFSGETTSFRGASFVGEKISFDQSYFSGKITSFRSASFAGEITDFRGASFAGEITDFQRTLFKDNTDFRDVIVTDTLRFDNSSWGRRVDFRGMSVKDLHWNSKDHPSNVKGVFDFREALIGSTTFKEVRFQDLVDFSRTTFGQYKVDLVEFLEVLELINIDFDPSQTHVLAAEPTPHVHFENNTFDNEADFLHVKFYSPAMFINNRFRRTLDLTGATFEAQNARLCLSFNRINRLVLEPESLGTPAGLSPLRQWVSLRTDPLQSSRIRQIAPSACPSINTPEKTINDRTVEPLDDIYKTLGRSFREANDQAGVNEAWYLETVAKRDNESGIEAWLSWFFFDLPSRYTVDVWRTVWISILLMVCFYILYLMEFVVCDVLIRPWRWLQKKPPREPREVLTLGHPERHRAFRLRIFEPIHRRIEEKDKRDYVPWRDAATLSVRAFLKIGLGTVYPNTRLLKCLTTVEWVLGAYMLIHFILAVKNNLPFVLPFLGVVH
jgi:uncharacterized protein YjbI with pentapeptide repeats